MFLNVLNEFKLLDNKTLSTKEVVRILASDNTLVFDLENAYNLDFEITFLEFFEALIGCALVAYKDQDLEVISLTESNENGHLITNDFTIDSSTSDNKHNAHYRSQIMSPQKSHLETLSQHESKKDLKRGSTICLVYFI